MSDEPLALQCALCKTGEDRVGSEYCRKCGARLVNSAGKPAPGASTTIADAEEAIAAEPPAGSANLGVSKTEPELSTRGAAAKGAPSSLAVIAAVRRVVEQPTGPPWYVAASLFIARAALVFVV